MKHLFILIFFLSFPTLADKPASTCVLNCTDEEIEKNTKSSKSVKTFEYEVSDKPASTCVLNCTDEEIEKNKENNHRETKSQGIQWQKLISGNGHEIYLAPNLSNWSGSNILLTFMTNNEKSIENSNIHSQIILTKLDCQNFRYAFNLIISKDETMGKGKTLHVEKYPNDWIRLGRGNKDLYQEMLFDTCNEEHVRRQLKILRNK